MTNFPRLYVYKASAGSGKTFTLAVQYIRQLIEYPHAYRHILAVTFTNKATGHSERFEINAYKKHCLMNGLDDVDFLVENRDKVELFEKKNITGRG